MFKSIIKEVGIMILLLITIVLVLAIILYDYSPTHKTIPKTLDEYKLPADIENELSKSVTSNTQNIIKTYTVEEKDLKNYEKTDEYDAGKINPFKLPTIDVISEQENITTGILNTIGK